MTVTTYLNVKWPSISAVHLLIQVPPTLSLSIEEIEPLEPPHRDPMTVSFDLSCCSKSGLHRAYINRTLPAILTILFSPSEQYLRNKFCGHYY